MQAPNNKQQLSTLWNELWERGLFCCLCADLQKGNSLSVLVCAYDYDKSVF